jgi:hypothetical protein
MGLNNATIPPGSEFRFLNATGGPGIQAKTSDIGLGSDAATFTVATPGVYLVTVAVGPAGPVQLEVNGTTIGPNETSCSGTSVCAFQRILTLTGPSTIALVNTTSSTEQENIGSGMTILRIS